MCYYINNNNLYTITYIANVLIYKMLAELTYKKKMAEASQNILSETKYPCMCNRIQKTTDSLIFEKTNRDGKQNK